MVSIKNKKSILIFVPHYLPGSKFGGPIQSVANIVDWINEEIRIKIITSDRDFLNKEPYKDIDINSWNKVGNAEVLYLSPKKINFKNLKQILNNTKFDLLYLSSLFHPKFSIVPILIGTLCLNRKSIKILIAPRGELSKGALEQKKIKKKIFIKILKYSGIANKFYWHATDQVEKNDIERELGVFGENIHVVSNLPKKTNNEKRGISNKRVGYLKVVYLSRITPMKNILYFIEILKEITDLDLELHLYGTVDDNNYWKQCLKKIDSLPSNITVVNKGHLENSRVLEVLSTYDLFILPTKGENYGHAIVESISAGTPVLISTNTPWRNLDEKKVGWDVNLDNREKFKEKIRELAKLDAKKMNRIKQTVKDRSIEVLGKDSVAHTKEMFHEIISDV